MLDWDKEKFESEVLEKIRGLNREQVVFFAWLCATRALPFIEVSRKLIFLEKTIINQFLYPVLNAIDIAANYGNIIGTRAADARADARVADAYNVAARAASAAFDAARAARAAFDAARAARAAADAARTAADARADARVATAAYDAYDAAVRTAAYACADAAYNAARAAYNAARAATFISFRSKETIELYKIILEDISYIKEGVYDKFNNDISLYGDVWDNFQKALNDIGCGYWGRLYGKIFENRFQVDKKALKMRLSVPQEIKDKGAKAVADYLEQMESEGSENLNEARIIILGEKGAGKTCLARRLVDPKAPMTELHESTEGVDSTIWTIEGKDSSPTVNAHIWDFAGHVITHAAHRCFLSERCLYILVYDGRTERRNQIEYWLDHVRDYGGDAPVLILINKFDDNKPDISENNLKRKYPFIADFAYFSVDKDENALKGRISSFYRQ